MSLEFPNKEMLLTLGEYGFIVWLESVLIKIRTKNQIYSLEGNAQTFKSRMLFLTEPVQPKATI